MSMVVSLYASMLALVLIYLSVLVIKERRKEKTALGSGGSRALEQRIRAHGNFTEYTPFFLILLFIAEIHRAPSPIIHGFGILYIFGRLLHIYGVIFYEKYDGEKLLIAPKFRVYGMICTFTSIILLAVTNLVFYFLYI